MPPESGTTRKLVFSGDIGNKDLPLLRDPQPTREADYVIMESTYGDRYHDKDRPDYVAALAQILQETFDRGGNVVIPSFAVGRTQEMLYFLGRTQQMADICKTDLNIFRDMNFLIIAAGNDPLDTALRVLHGVKRLHGGLGCASLSLSVFPLRLGHLNMRAVAQHDAAQIGSGMGHIDLAPKTLGIQ